MASQEMTEEVLDIIGETYSVQVLPVGMNKKVKVAEGQEEVYEFMMKEFPSAILYIWIEDREDENRLMFDADGTYLGQVLNNDEEVPRFVAIHQEGQIL